MFSIEEESFIRLAVDYCLNDARQAAEDLFQDAKSRGYFTDDIKTLQDLVDAHNMGTMCWSI